MFSPCYTLLFAFLTLGIHTCDSAEEQKYYCPRGEMLLGKNCYLDMKSHVKTREDAKKYCKSLGKELPNSFLSENKLSGWLEETSETRSEVKGEFCIYSYPSPLGSLSPDNPLFNIAPCSRKLHVLCSKQLPTNSVCESGWSEVVKNTYKYCVKVSDIKTSVSPGSAGFDNAICPENSQPFSFNYRDIKEDLKYKVDKTDKTDLLQPFWTPFYITKANAAKSVSGESVRNITCLYKTGSLHVMPVLCDSVKKFHCQSTAREIPQQQENPDTYSPDKDYSCGNKNDVLCEDKCYKHWKSYETQEEAEKNCTSAGYKLTSQPVPCIQYTTGWVEGSYENGNLTTSCTLPLLKQDCVYFYKGETKLGDCRMRTNALHTVQLGDGESFCPDNFYKCGSKQLCVASSNQELTWGDAVNTVHRDRRRLLAIRSELEDCSETIKNKFLKPHWVGATRSQGGIVQFENGEEITVKSEKECLKMVGGKLITASCNTTAYFTCEKLAEPHATSSTLVIILVVGPFLLLGVILLLVYRKKGKEMCLSRSTAAGVEEGDIGNGVTLSNPLAEEEEIHEEEETNKDGVENGTSANEINRHLYEETDI